MSAEYWRDFGERRRSCERTRLEQQGRALIYLGGQGSVYSTAYREAISETAKLADEGNSQVLSLQKQKKKKGLSLYNYVQIRKFTMQCKQNPTLNSTNPIHQ